MRKILVIAIVVCLVSISIGLALTYKIWGYGIFPGYIRVNAYTQDPTPTGSPLQNSIKADVFVDGKSLGQSGTEIQVTSGEHTISFGTYSLEYETPIEEHIIVEPFEKTYLSAYYLSLYGYLVVDTELYNEYFQNYSSIDAGIFVDGGYAGSGYLCLKLNLSDLGSHTVSFSEMDGCTKPVTQTASVTEGTTTKVTGTYKKILTPEQEVYIFCRKRISGYGSVLNATSNIDVDQFLQWMLDSRITEVKVFVAKPRYIYGEKWSGQCRIDYYIARYAGIYEEEKIGAAEDIFYRLNSSGIDLRSSGYLKTMHYENDAEYLVVANLEFEINWVNVEGEFYKFEEADIDGLPDLSGTMGIEGIGFACSDTRQVYVETDSIAKPFEESYVPPFREYADLTEDTKGWTWSKWKYGGSIDLRDLFRSLRMERL